MRIASAALRPLASGRPYSERNQSGSKETSSSVVRTALSEANGQRAGRTDVRAVQGRVVEIVEGDDIGRERYCPSGRADRSDVTQVLVERRWPTDLFRVEVDKRSMLQDKVRYRSGLERSDAARHSREQSQQASSTSHPSAEWPQARTRH